MHDPGRNPGSKYFGYNRLALSLAFVVTVFLPLQAVRGADSVARLDWAWTESEQRTLHFLASQAQRDSKGYWSLKDHTFQVRSDVSKELTADLKRYVELMLKAMPRALGFPLMRGDQFFQLTVHKTKGGFREAAGAASSGTVFHQVLKDAGREIADVHILADEAGSGAAGIPLAKQVNLRLLQREAVRAALLLGAKGGNQSVFASEGLAAVFESVDLREQRPPNRSQMARNGRAAYLRALQKAFIESGMVQPDLVAAYAEPKDAFLKQDTDLKNALALSFADYLLASSQTASRIPAFLYPGEVGSGAWIDSMKALLALEEGWHKHICQVLAGTVYIQKIDVPVGGQPAREPPLTGMGRYGTVPLIALSAAADGGYDVAWYESAARAIHVVRMAADNSKRGAIAPDFIGKTGALLGFCNVPDRKVFMVGHSKDNAHGNKDAEFWVSAFTDEGKKVFQTRIFGEQSDQSPSSKGYPGNFGSARLAYNPAAKNVGVYVSHTQKQSDNWRHQAGYFSLLSLAGENKVVAGWYISHNFDQRLVVRDGSFYLLAHGDAFPRALVLEKRNGSGGSVFQRQYHKIPGVAGDNNTHCQTGGLAVLADQRVAVVFITMNGRTSRDVCIKLFDADGKETATRWLTEYPAGILGTFPRIAAYEDGLLVAWEQGDFGGSTTVMQCVLLDMALNVKQSIPAEGVHVSPFNDLVNLKCGAVAWAAAGSGNAIRVYRIDGEKVMHSRLLKSLQTDQARASRVRHIPKEGVVKPVDSAIVSKLARLSAANELPPGTMRLSKAAALVKLVSSDEKGALTFAAPSGQTAVFEFADLDAIDKAAITATVVGMEPGNQTLCGVAGFYMLAAGQNDLSRLLFAQAGPEQAQKFRSYFTEK